MMRFLFTFLPVFVLGCDVTEQAERERAVQSTTRYAEGSPEALGLQTFLNDPGTTEALLDDDVALDARAARNLIAHRNGSDGVLGTGDDDLFETVAEIDDVSYVGESALNKLFDYAIANGWVSEDVARVVEGVTFTPEQAEATVALANAADLVTLDDVVGLDSRAANNIIADRPLADIEALAAVSYVGGSALTRLRDYAAANPLPELAEEWESCDTAADCAAGLVCMGEFAWGGDGMCVSEDLAGTFTATPDLAIPAGATVTDTINITGLASVSIDVVVTLDIEHPRPQDLTLKVSNPLGTGNPFTVTADNLTGSPFIVRGIPSDEDANGTWTLSVTDDGTGDAGEVVSWELYIISMWD